MTTPAAYRRDIDGLRSPAVVPVVLNHAGIPGVSGGYIGVDIFFVISGFLITGILAREIAEKRFSIIGFYERRARRILPALFALLIVCMVAGAVLLPPKPFVDLVRSAGATLFFVSNMWFLRSTSDYFGPDADFEPLLHTWSLAVEEQFYIVFPLLLWALVRSPRSVLAGVVASISLMSLALSVWATGAYPQANFFLSPPRAWELGLGAMLALGMAPTVRHRLPVELVAALGLAAIVYAIVFYDDQTPFPGATALIPCLGAAAIIWAGQQRSTLVGRILSNPVPVGIGLISYSLYLWHWPVLIYFRTRQGLPDLPHGIIVQAIVIALVLACLSWRYVERPFRKAGPGGLSRSFIFRGSAAVIALIFAAGLAVELRKGFPGRMPPEVNAIYEAAQDRWSGKVVCQGKYPPQDACTIGVARPAAASQDLLLWGDSHAAAVAPGLDRFLADAGLSGVVAFKSACPPILGVVRARWGSDNDCDDFNVAVLKMLQERPDFPVVLLVARWAMAAESERAPGERGRPVELRRAGPVRRPPPG